VCVLVGVVWVGRVPDHSSPAPGFWLVKEPLLDCKTIGFAKH